MQNIYLVGFMATGKTSVGEALAEKLNKNFIDLDDLIQKKEGKRIIDIFRDHGEPYFRKIEKEVAREISGKSDFVIGCGGGFVVDPDNLSVLKGSGTVICLTASVDEILSRCKDSDQRPLLNVKNPREQAAKLLSEREPSYKSADFTVDTTNLSIDGAANLIYQFITSKKNSHE